MGITDTSTLDSLFINDLKSVPLIALSLLPVGNVNGWVFTRITMTSMTGKWYLPLTHFEALLVGLVVLEIFVMRYFLILPLDVTKLIENGTLLATDVSRKKRMAPSENYTEIHSQQRLAETMFTILRRLDKDDCMLRTLCELEFSATNGGEIHPKKISKLLANLKRLGLKRIQNEKLTAPNNITITDRKVLSHFEEAVLVGSGNGNALSCDSSPSDESCESYYSLCTTEKDELLHYVRKIEPFLLG